MTAAPALAALALLGVLAGAAHPAAATHPLPVGVTGARPAARDADDYLPRWRWPLPPVPRVVRPFDAPPSPWAAGHRGVDLAGADGTSVRAVDAGVVTHVGVIAGRGTVTITHPGDIRSTYEPVTSTLTFGQSVGTSQVVGSLDTAAGHCAPATCLHLGALRRGSDGVWAYIDPLLLLIPVEIVLLPGPR